MNRESGLLAGAMTMEMTAEECDLRYWLGEVPQGMPLDGHDPALTPPPHMLAPGPLRDAIATR
jgi:hypothetical protein